MLKFGICDLSDGKGMRRLLSANRKYFRRSCFIGLYDEALALEGESAERCQEAILNSFAIANHAFKRTSKDRFTAFDETSTNTLAAIAAIRDSCVVHDLAASDGRTACDFFARLSGVFGSALEFYASDLCVRVTVLGFSEGHTRVVVDEHGNVLQLLFAPFVLSLAQKESWLYPVNRCLRAVLMRTAVSRVLRLSRANDPAIERRDIVLVCPQAKRLMQTHANFHFEVYDIFDKAPRHYTVVRAMNILNPGYFDDAALSSAVANVFESLEEGGVFITGSNEDAGSIVNGTIYRKRGGAFEPICLSGKGSPVDSIVTHLSKDLLAAQSPADGPAALGAIGLRANGA